MLKKALTTCLAGVALLSSAVSVAQTDPVKLDYYLPQDVQYNPSIPTPEEALGYQVGEWHVRHDQIVHYMYQLAESSDRITIEETGRTHEQRPLLLLTITSPDNQKNIDAVREKHLAAADPNRDADDDTPLVLYMGYSIHGDESSGSNAAMLFAYYLAAAQNPALDKTLQDTVVLLDPSLNPDGLARFAQWANQHRSKNLVADPQSREHVQPFVRGRVNHYWFDLNRDWLLLQHPESRARIANFQKWKPNVLTDFHEMGTNSTFFFQPGIPSRKNPLTPDENVRLTEILAAAHADSLDNLGNLYYTEESFDDFYYGKGSTYPDIQGAVGVLFEQASSRGHLQDSVNGEVSFPFTIRNQFITSLSTLYGSHANKKRFIDFQERVYDDAIEAGDDANFDGYLIGASDVNRLSGLVELLKQHGIDGYRVERDVETNNKQFKAGLSYFIPAEQAQYGLIQAIFSTRKDFPDNTFYDVSGWTLPMAFNVQFSTYRGRINLDDTAWNAPQRDAVPINANAYALAFDWHDYKAPAMLQALLEQDVHARQSFKPLHLPTTNGQTANLSAGSVVVTRAYQNQNWSNVVAAVKNIAEQQNVTIYSVKTGLTPKGIDLGSRNIQPVKEPSVMMLTGDGVNLYEAGEAWYYLDRHVGLPLSMVDTDRISRVDLNRYSHIILVDGSYYTLSEGEIARLTDWVRQGGVLIGQQGGAEWMSRNGLLYTQFVEDKTFSDAFSTAGLTYKDRDSYYAQRRIAGAIFQMDIDPENPLMFGFPNRSMPVFKDELNAMESPQSPFVSVAHYSDQPLLSGYADKRNQAVLAGKTNIAAHRFGEGRVIGFADNVNFRAFFWGTAKLLSNAIYLAPAIETYADPVKDKAAADEAAAAH